MLLQRNIVKSKLQKMQIAPLAICKMLYCRLAKIEFIFDKKFRYQIILVTFFSVIVQFLPLSVSAQSTSFFKESSHSISDKKNGMREGGDNSLDGQAGNEQKHVRRVSNWLDIENNVLQIDRVIQQNLQYFTSSLSASEAKELRKGLQRHNNSQSVLKSVHSKIGIALTAELNSIEHLLVSPLPVRVRNFDVAMSMTGAKDKFRVFRENLQMRQPSSARLDLIKRLDSALKTTALVALIQTEINVTTQLLFSKISKNTEPFLPPGVIDFQRQQRMDYIAEVSSDLHLFSYRFLKDEELIQYVELLEEPDIQLLIEIAYESIRQILIQSRENVLAVN
ncbi:MAG: hypothetical protein ACI92E_003072 [Oceanicoccus sp.]|jgi:hypothetical protein